MIKFCIYTIFFSFFFFPNKVFSQDDKSITFSVTNGKIKESKKFIKYSLSNKIKASKVVIRVFYGKSILLKSKRYVFYVVTDSSKFLMGDKCANIFDKDSNSTVLYKTKGLDSQVFFSFICNNNLVILKRPKTRKMDRKYYDSMNNISFVINDIQYSWKKIELACNKHLYKTVL